MFIKIWKIFLPVQLFPPVCLLAVGKCSSLYFYFILYDYLVLNTYLKVVKIILSDFYLENDPLYYVFYPTCLIFFQLKSILYVYSILLVYLIIKSSQPYLKAQDTFCF